MPRATLSVARLGRLVGRPIPRAELTELLFASKTQVEGGEGDVLEVEGTADRLDLLTESGLSLELKGALGTEVGRPAVRPLASPTLSFHVDASVVPTRPSIAGVVVAPPEGTTLDADLLEEAIRFQELLHATIGLDRRLASLGIYPVERIRGPVAYAMEPIDAVRFVPLDGTGEVGAEEFFAGHPMALKYGAFGRAGAGCLTLRDAAGAILSLPPILNSRGAGEARVGDGALLLESTGLRSSRVLDAVALLSLVFLARGWSAAAVPVAAPKGVPVLPSALETRRLHLPDRTLAALAGDVIPAPEVERSLRRARFDAHREAHGWSVEAAPWRVDLHGPVDVAEDLLIARGLKVEDGILPPSTSRGARSPSARFRTRVADLLLGLGFVPLYSPVLVAERLVVLTSRPRTLALANPVSDQFARMRDSLLTALAGALEHNVRHAYPQRFSEVGPVVVAQDGSESGAETRYHAAVVVASEASGFAEAAAIVDYVMRTLGAVGVREPAALPATIAGRAASVRLAGVVVAELGELAPELLDALHVPVPAAWAELDLTALERLLASPKGHAPARSPAATRSVAP